MVLVPGEIHNVGFSELAQSERAVSYTCLAAPLLCFCGPANSGKRFGIGAEQPRAIAESAIAIELAYFQ